MTRKIPSYEDVEASHDPEAQREYERQLRERYDKTPDAIAPFVDPVDDFPLRRVTQGTMTDANGRTCAVTDAQFALSLQSDITVRLAAQAASASMLVHENPFRFDAATGPNNIPILATRISPSGVDGIATGTSLTVTGTSNAFVHELRCHLVNIRALHGTWIRAKASMYCGRAEAKLTDWHLIVDTINGLDEHGRNARERGGSLMTHVLSLRKSDGSAFRANAGLDEIKTFASYLAFVVGRHVGPVLFRGYDSQGQVIFEDWSTWRSSRWQAVLALGDSDSLPSLISAYPAFAALHSNALWRDSLTVALGLFVQGNAYGMIVEAGLALMQAALEHLAYAHAAAGNFIPPKRPYAAYEITETLKYLGISDAIPNQLSNLATLATAQTWSNGPAAIVGVRKGVMHGNHAVTLLAMTPEQRSDARQLASHYVERIILAMMGYTGQIYSRIERNLITI